MVRIVQMVHDARTCSLEMPFSHSDTHIVNTQPVCSKYQHRFAETVRVCHQSVKPRISHRLSESSPTVILACFKPHPDKNHLTQMFERYKIIYLPREWKLRKTRHLS